MERKIGAEQDAIGPKCIDQAIDDEGYTNIRVPFSNYLHYVRALKGYAGLASRQ